MTSVTREGRTRTRKQGTNMTDTIGYVKCRDCDGEGQFEMCSICGLVLDNCEHDHTNGRDTEFVDCPGCDGQGEYEPDDAEAE